MKPKNDQLSLFGESLSSNDKFSIDELFRRSRKYKGSSEFIKFFDFIVRFDHYSRYNTMLVYTQNPAITFFGGISFWRNKFCRTIKQEARPYIILAPNGPVMLVYDVFDTEGNESPEDFLQKGLGKKPIEVMGTLDEKIFINAIKTAESWGIDISYKPLSYFNAGYIHSIGDLKICLKEGMSTEENFSVLIHELAHLFLGHTNHKQLHKKENDKQLKLIPRKLTRAIEELEAETVSYLITHKLGLETQSAEYIAGFLPKDNNINSFSFELVIKNTDKIEVLFI